MSEKYLGENLIFILSLPRSGSTMLQRVLAGHSEVSTSSEPWIMLHPSYGRGAKHYHADYDPDWAQLGVDEFLENYTDGPDVYDDGIRAFAQTIYANALAKGGGTYFLDKTPRYILIVDDLIELFPKAKFIFLIRNPLSILSSIVNTQINHDLTTLERFSNELLRGPSGLLSGIKALGDKAIVLHYESFVENPEEGLKKLCGQLGLSFDPAMLEYSKSPEVRGFMQDRTGINQHDRPTNSRAESWKKMLGDYQQLDFAQGYLRDLGRDTVEELGYSYDDLMDPVRESINRTRKTFILPWNIAILTPGQKLGRAQNYVFKYRYIRDRGPVVGRVLAAFYYISGIFRVFKFVFGTSKNVGDRSRKSAPQKPGNKQMT
jgi:hypothetical protein